MTRSPACSRPFFKMNHSSTAFKIDNIRLFIAFRIFFNCRFYYPVFTIFFLDFGLSLEQFALLNVAWAATIVLLEVPSGALADIIGRRNLLVASGVLMVIEMALLCFAPRGNPDLLFIIFLINRILSGTAEAAASGADEALAYDTLQQLGRTDEWPHVLELQMRLKAFVSMVVMTIGAVIYDPAAMQWIADHIGWNFTFTQGLTMRFPVFLTFLMAIFTLFAALKMEETSAAGEMACEENQGCGKSTVQAFRLTLIAGGWILKTPMALIIILFGLLFDHIIRMLLTLNSQYFRLIDLPEASFGLIGSGMAMLGLFMPRLARFTAERYSPGFNLILLGFFTLIGLIGMTFFIPVVGLLPMLLLYSVMLMTVYYLSFYLNRITDSSQRATVLSFKGLSFNLAYGSIGIVYSMYIAFLRTQQFPESVNQSVDNIIFIRSLSQFPWYFLLCFVALTAFAYLLFKNKTHAKSDKM